jgi:hypothetical protein
MMIRRWWPDAAGVLAGFLLFVVVAQSVINGTVERQGTLSMGATAGVSFELLFVAALAFGVGYGVAFVLRGGDD